MIKALLARKIGMTQIFDAQGRAIPVTVLKAGPCYIAQIKNVSTDGYDSIQLAFGEEKEHRVNRPLRGHYQRAGVQPCRYLKEFRVGDAGRTFSTGQELRASIFNPGDMVDVSAVSRGKGFAGSIKRLGFHRGPETHGSHYHRGPGSLGSIAANRVFRGRLLPGRMGGRQCTVQNLGVVKVDSDHNLLLIRGSVPGPQGGLVEVKESVKK